MKKTITIKLTELCIMDELYHHIVNIEINKVKGILLIDSGASRTMFDTERFKRFKSVSKTCQSPMNPSGIGGQVQANLTILRKIKIEKLSISNYAIGIIDLSHINNMFTSFKKNPIDGVLGADMLKSHGAILNFRNNTLCLSFDEKEINKKNSTMKAAMKKHLNI